ncbi:MAG: D-2-hydroxyacid dehydrogenase [Butyricicoccus sp.]|nr:D-2-hydroxyacid dehydrogenase [Butyricicoccus sp.]
MRDRSWGPLEQLGALTVYDRTPNNSEEILRRIGDAEILYTSKTPLSASTLQACPNLRFICVLATGYNIVDVAAATAQSITVCNIPTYGTAAVGQFAIALLLEICHHIGHHNQAVHEGRWSSCPDWCFWDYPLIELAGKTMGILGFGRIGQTTGRIAKALGMRVLAFDTTPNDSGREIAEYVSLDTLLAESDVISVHCPLFDDTRGIICKANIDKMKDGVILLNNSRGPLVVEQDLADALNSGKVYAAGLDVVATEPIQPDNPLLSAKNCIITPHISWASKESRQRLMDIAVDNLRQFLQGTPINTVQAH